MDLQHYLQKIEKNSPVDLIKLGLERVKKIAVELDVMELNAFVIMVAGTNGKGSTIATLEQLLVSHGKNVGTYTSPHLIKFNERIKINSLEVTELEIVKAFEKITEINTSKQLSYYEWVTLAALIIFKQAKLDYMLLEVGLGGRLDAVNIIDADVAIITSIDFDHMDLLGNSLDEIGFEKAGIFRKDQVVFCAEPSPPSLLLKQAQKHNVKFNQINRDYSYKGFDDSWQFQNNNLRLVSLPISNLHLNNVATALACFDSLDIECSPDSISLALNQIKLVGRCQLIKGEHDLILDVAHNNQSISYLAEQLSKLPNKCSMVFSMLNNKELDFAINKLKTYVEHWYIAPLKTPRSYTKNQLEELFIKDNINNFNSFNTIKAAFNAARSNIKQRQTLVVCGSFLTVSEVQ